MVQECRERGIKFMKKWSRKYTGAAATQHGTAAAKDALKTSTTVGPDTTGARTTAPIEPFDQPN